MLYSKEMAQFENEMDTEGRRKDESCEESDKHSDREPSIKYAAKWVGWLGEWVARWVGWGGHTESRGDS